MKKTILSVMSLSALFNLPLNAVSEVQEADDLIAQILREKEVTHICTELELNYSGWRLKARIKQGEGFLLNPESKRAALPVADGKWICEHFLEKEKKAVDPDLNGLSERDRNFKIAKSNLEYSDRLQGLIAAFKDSHLSIWRRTLRAEVFYGFSLKEIAGNFYISDIGKATEALWSKLGSNAPNVGDQVISWNGQDLEKALKPMMRLVSGSTERAIRAEALRALTRRRFSYPDSAEVEIVFIPQGQSHQKQATASLFFDEGRSDEVSKSSNVARSLDDLAYLDHIKAINYKSLKQEQKPEGDSDKVRLLIKRSFLEDYRNELADNLMEWTRYCNSDHETIAITGRLKSDQSVAYLKIHGFSDRRSFWTVASKGNSECGHGASVQKSEEDLKEQLRIFLTEFSRRILKESTPRVILDLRHNGGGNSENVNKLVSLFLESGRSAKGSRDYHFLSYLTNQVKAGVIHQELGYDHSADYENEALAKWREQLATERRFSANAREEDKIFISPPAPQKKIESAGVFSSNPDLLVWTGSGCVSACEEAVMVFSDNRLAKVMGTPTAGTGMGMYSDSDFSTLSKTHDIYYALSFFGPPVVNSSCENASVATHTPAQILECRIQGISENRPAKIDLPYEETLEDLLQNGKGWIDQSRSYFSQGSKEGAVPGESHDSGGSSPIAEPAPAKH